MVHQAKIRLNVLKSHLDRAIVSTMAFSFMRLRSPVAFFIALALYSCNQSELKEPLVYDGPLRIVENIELFYTEDNHVKVKMIAAEVHEFENEDREFPNGIYLEFYDETGKLESTLDFQKHQRAGEQITNVVARSRWCGSYPGSVRYRELSEKDDLPRRSEHGGKSFPGQ